MNGVGNMCFLLLEFQTIQDQEYKRRHHLYDTVIQKAIKQAIRDTGITKHASCHTFRHSFATVLVRISSDTLLT